MEGGGRQCPMSESGKERVKATVERKLSSQKNVLRLKFEIVKERCREIYKE